jgi:hypothetical protein
MTPRIALALLVALAGLAQEAQASSPSLGRIRRIPLDESVVHRISVHERFVTTISFPSRDGIEAIHGSNITRARDDAGFFVEYVPNTYFLSIRALQPGAEGSLNIVYKKKTLVIRLGTVPEVKHADLSVFFEDDGATAGGSSARRPRATPTTLVSLMDKARMWKLYEKNYPQAVIDAQQREPNQVCSYDQFDIIVAEVTRFDAHDALVFKLLLRNKTDRMLTYDVRSFAVRVGTTLLHASVADASGVVPPAATDIAYVAFAGGPEGRNNFSVENEFKFMITLTEPEGAEARILGERIDDMARTLSPDMSPEDLQRIEAEYKAVKEIYEAGVRP